MRYHWHTPLAMYAGFVLLVGVGAVNSQNNLLFLLLGLAIGGLMVSGVVSGSALMRLHARREPVAPGVVGQPVRFGYTLTSRNRFIPGFALIVEESRGGVGGLRDATWPGVLPIPRAYAPHLPRRGSASATTTIMPMRRGELQLVGVRVVTRFPFGLVEKSVTFPQQQSVLVYPRLVPLRRRSLEGLFAEHHFSGQSRRVGWRSEDFYGLRDYVPGDSPRLIAWKPTARTGEVVVREHAGGSARRVWIVLSIARRAPGVPPAATESAEEAAISLAASLADEALRAGLSVGLSAPGLGVLIPIGANARQRSAILEALARLDVSRAASQSSSPPRFGRVDTVLAVHAGAIDPSAAPPGAMHLSGDDLDSIAEPGALTTATAAAGGNP